MTEFLLQTRRLAAIEVMPGRNARRVTAVITMALLTTLGAYAEIPLGFTVVPITLQTLFVSLAGLLLGPALGAAAMVTYITAGALGAPVFSGGAAGVAWLLGPTGGYLIAFPFAAAVTGKLAGAPRKASLLHIARLIVITFVGTLVIFAGGAAQLAIVTGDPVRAIQLGVIPFLIGDVVKVLLAVLIAQRLRNRTLGLL